MMKRNFIFLLLSFILPLVACPQEYLTGLPQNYDLRKQSAQHPQMLIKQVMATPLALPFLDDFSAGGPFPSSSRWIDKDVYVNQTYGYFPPTLGVATLDVLNDTGAIYSDAAPSPFIADHLTSQFIDLSSYTPNDSVYLSFFYQPQGYGNDPEDMDSLVLEFLEIYRADTLVDTTANPYDTLFFDKWRPVWSTTGMALDTFIVLNHMRNFALTMLPLTDPVWFRNDFRFRFYNYGSVASTNIPSWRSNCDHWNLDYIYLNRGRKFDDTLFRDMTFVNPAPSFLKNYQAMPFSQFTATDMADSVKMYISNIGKDTPACHYVYSVRDESGQQIHSYNGGDYNLLPYYTGGYQTWNPHQWPDITNFTFPVTPTDTSYFTITHVISRLYEQELNKQNDTVRFQQGFENYFAYDDCSAEAGYGLSPKGSMLAYHFALHHPDTLRGVQMFFNRVIDNANQKNFYLCVWADSLGLPGKLIYKNSKLLKPLYSDSLENMSFYLFDAASPIVLGSGQLSFFVGWIQQTDDNLNVGWDMNHDASDQIFYNINGIWQKTAFKGSLIIRPMLGAEVKLDGHKVARPGTSKLMAYPNPTTGRFFLDIPDSPDVPGTSKVFELSVYTLLGSHILTLPYRQSFDLSWLRPGAYLLRLHTTDEYLSYQTKLLINK